MRARCGSSMNRPGASLLDASLAFAVGALALLGGVAAFAEGDPAAGKTLSGVCAACHGSSGTSSQEVWPNLAGQRFGYLVQQLMAFRDGSRSNPVMEPIAKGLSDQDIKDLAAYYATQAPAASPAADDNGR